MGFDRVCLQMIPLALRALTAFGMRAATSVEGMRGPQATTILAARLQIASPISILALVTKAAEGAPRLRLAAEASASTTAEASECGLPHAAQTTGL